MIRPAYTAKCAGCGKPFEPKAWNQLRCKPRCNRLRTYADPRGQAAKNRARAAERAGPRTFIAVDGEGVDDELTGEHKYVLLTVGNKRLDRDGARLGFAEICEFLWSCFLENPKTVYVGFYLPYDWSQWLKSLPEERAMRLLSKAGIAARARRDHPEAKHRAPLPVEHKGWQFDYLPGRRFKLRRPVWQKVWLEPTEDKPGRWVWQATGPWMWICDAGPFYQSSFLRAIDPRGNPTPVCSEEEYRIIEEGKARRDCAELDPRMVAYNELECEILARLMAQLEEGARGAGLRLKKNEWIGPGQLAEKWLKKIGAPKGEEVREVTPEPVRAAAQASYCGGWFEQFWHGKKPGTCFEHDINSAYPYVMAGLPCLLHGHWELISWPVTKEGQPRRLVLAEAERLLRGRRFGFVRARVKGNHPVVGAMLHRKANRQILRPRQTEGWYFLPELAAAWEAAFVDEIRGFEAWIFHKGCDCPPPLAEIANLYEERLKVGKQSVYGKAFKLIYNSVYGKLAQSVGEPKYANPIYAAAITASCRMMIVDAIRTHPRKARALVSVATDGVVFDSPHGGLDFDETRLGAWSTVERENLTLFLPGIYWDDATRARLMAGTMPVFKSRGIPAKDIAKRLAILDRAWDRMAQGNGWPQLMLRISFHVTSPQQALAQGKWTLCGAVEKGKARVIKADPYDKRRATAPGPSEPWDFVRDKSGQPALVSLPYQGTFGDELRALSAAEFGLHPDGPIAELLPELLVRR